MLREILIVGAGTAGLASAIALGKNLTPRNADIRISIFERKEQLSTSGGAVSLTPMAQKLLDELGVLSELDNLGSEGGIQVGSVELFSLRTSRSLGQVRFTDEDGNNYGRFVARRVMRSSLAVAMVAVIEKLENISIHYNKKLVDGYPDENDANRITLRFDDGTTATGDLVLGCDGVHSTTRTQIVDPQNVAEYTGISFIQSTFDASTMKSPFYFQTTALNLSRQISLLTTFCDQNRDNIFIAAILPVSQHVVDQHRAGSGMEFQLTSRAMTTALRYMVRERSRQCTQPCLREMIDKPRDWMLYPVYQVQAGRKWYIDRVLLLGDAAHAMPPRDESSTYALEDAIFFSQILTRYYDSLLQDAFRAFENLRRGLIDKAFDASRKLWQESRDMGLLPSQIKELITPIPSSFEKSTETPKTGTFVTTAAIPVPTHDSFSDLSVYSLAQRYADN
ncbi:hypothetical protein TCE0_044f16262 [Talaromyces pinophilus]|uniref:FAD-binding domain-containing protein n=1 Tax=Talaromyces pinophilus TaxID=128442 RepID=A0A478EAJ1_TALPI|nr:hypothetical protein TCE0_044f16262 [Talaromyces pinophilus]